MKIRCEGGGRVELSWAINKCEAGGCSRSLVAGAQAQPREETGSRDKSTFSNSARWAPPSLYCTSQIGIGLNTFLSFSDAVGSFSAL